MSNLLVCRVCYCAFESQSEYSTHYNSNHLPQQSINTDQNQSIFQSSDQSALPNTNQSIPNVNNSTAATQSLSFTTKSESIDEQNENESFTSPFDFVPSETVPNPSEPPSTIDTDKEAQSTNQSPIDSSPSTSNIELSVPDNGTELRCSHCDRSFTKPHFLRMHLRYNPICSKPNSAEYSNKKCRFCGKLFSQSRNRYRHEQNIHVKPDSYPFVCSCGTRFKAAFSLKAHQQSKTTCEKRRKLKLGSREPQRRLTAATEPSQQPNTSKTQSLSASACASMPIESRSSPTKRKHAESLIESVGDDEPLINVQNEAKRSRITQSSSSATSISCERCGDVFSSRNGLGRHAKRPNACQAFSARMEKAKPFACRKGCGARFRFYHCRHRHEHSASACAFWQKSKNRQAIIISQLGHQQTVTTKHQANCSSVDFQSERFLCEKGCGASFAFETGRNKHHRLVKCSIDEPSTSTSIVSTHQSINNSLPADYRCVDCGRRLKDDASFNKHRSQCLKRALNESMKTSRISDSNTQDRSDEVFCLISNQTALKAATHCFHSDHLKPVKAPTETALGAEDGYMTKSNIQLHDNSVEQPVNQDISEKTTESSTSTNEELEDLENLDFDSSDELEWNLLN